MAARLRHKAPGRSAADARTVVSALDGCVRGGRWLRTATMQGRGGQVKTRRNQAGAADGRGHSDGRTAGCMSGRPGQRGTRVVSCVIGQCWDNAVRVPSASG